MIQDPSLKAEATFCIHLIALSGARRRPKARVLFVATDGADAVYEGQGTLAKCLRWIRRLRCPETEKQDVEAAKKDFVRNRYAVLRQVTASPLAIESLGLQRADRDARDPSALAVGASSAE